eukprot:scaffold103266_cov66-Phaeocystis_antarctica.AAC.3
MRATTSRVRAVGALTTIASSPSAKAMAVRGATACTSCAARRALSSFWAGDSQRMPSPTRTRGVRWAAADCPSSHWRGRSVR